MHDTLEEMLGRVGRRGKMERIQVFGGQRVVTITPIIAMKR
jgi:hypothetical protein